MNVNRLIFRVGFVMLMVGLGLVVGCGRTEAPVEVVEPSPASQSPADQASDQPGVTLQVNVEQTFAQAADQFLTSRIETWGEQNGVEIEIARLGGEAVLENAQSLDCGTIGSLFLPRLRQDDLLVDLAESVNRLDAAGGGLLAGALAAVSDEGKQWAIPYAASTYIFYVRQDKLTGAGLPLPETWEEALAAAQAINAPDEGFWGWGMQFGNSGDTRASFLAQLGAYGGSLWDESGRPAIDSAETRQVLDLLRQAWESGIVPTDALTWDDTSNNAAYQEERVGMVLNAGSILEYLRTEDRDLLDRTQVIVVPAGPAGRYVSGTFSQWGIFKGSSNIHRCFELSEWLFAPDQLRGYYEAAGGLFLPTYTALLDDEFWQQSHLQTVAETLPYTYPPGYPGPTTPWALDGLNSNIIPQLMQRILVDGWDNEQAIAEADESLQQLYDNWQTR